MLANKELGESGYVAEELFGDKDYEMERQCITIKNTVERGLFSLEQALDAYGVSHDNYIRFLDRYQKIATLSEILLTSSTEIPGYSMFVGVVGNNVQITLLDDTNKIVGSASKGKKITRLLSQIKEEIESHGLKS